MARAPSPRSIQTFADDIGFVNTRAQRLAALRQGRGFVGHGGGWKDLERVGGERVDVDRKGRRCDAWRAVREAFGVGDVREVERFPNGAPLVPLLPDAVHINPVAADAIEVLSCRVRNRWWSDVDRGSERALPTARGQALDVSIAT